MTESRGTSADSYIGSLISLTSKSEIRYEGILYTVDTEQANIALQNVRSFGTEGRKQNGPQIPPSEKVYDYIIFRSSDIKDLQVKSAPGAAAAAAPAAPPQPAPTPVEAPPAPQPGYTQASPNVPPQPAYPPQPTPPPLNNAINPQYGPIPTPIKPGMPPPTHPSYQPPAMWGGPLPHGPNQPPGSNMYWQNYYPAPGLQPPMPRPPIHPQAGFLPSQQPPYHQIPPNYMQQGLQHQNPQAQPGLVTPQTLQVHSTSEQKPPASGQSSVTQPQNDAPKSFDNPVQPLTRPDDLLNPSVESTTIKPAGLETAGEPASHVLESVQAPPSTAREPTPAAPLIDLETEKSVDTVGEVKPAVVTPDLLGDVTSGSIPQSSWNEVPAPPVPKPVISTYTETKPSPPAVTELRQEPRKPTDEPILPLPSQPPQRGGGVWRGGNAYQVNAAYSSNYRRGKGRTSNGIGRGASQADKTMPFSEDFDFTAMNEKFKKDEVWGELGGKTDKENEKEGEHEGSLEGNGVEKEEEHGDESYHDENSQSSKKKMLYRKDDFFDEISCDSLNASEGRERMRFSEQRKLDSETFGDVKLDSNRNWGYRSGYRSGGGGGYRGKGRMGGGQSGYGSRSNGYAHPLDRNFVQDAANSYSTSDQSGRSNQRGYGDQGRRGGYGGQGGSGYGSGRGGHYDSGYTKGRGGYGRESGGYGDRRGYAQDQGGYQGADHGNYGGNETGYSREGYYGGRGRGGRDDKGRQGGNRYGTNERYGMEGVI